MNKEFLLEYTNRKGIVFDGSSICDRDIGGDIDLFPFGEGMFVVFIAALLKRSAMATACISASIRSWRMS